MRSAFAIIGETLDPSPLACEAGHEMSSLQNITQLLRDWGDGDAAALERLLPLVEKELAALASRYMRAERRGHTLQTRDLVNEAYLKLFGQKRVRWHNRSHFFGIAAIIMRRILLDHAKGHGRQKRGGGVQRVSLSDASLMSEERAAELIDLNEALCRLEKLDWRKGLVVNLKYFGGLSVKEIAEILNIATSTVSEDWKFAKAWLRVEMSHEK